MLEVILLGCGGSMPLPNRYLSAALIQYKGRKILIDCGEGTQVSMREIKSGFKTLDLICLTHLHGDHINGLPGLLATVGNSGRTEPILIIGPTGTEKIWEGIKMLVPYLPFAVEVLEKPLEVDSLTLSYYDEEIQLTTLDLDHSSFCLGYRFDVKRQPKFDVEKAVANQVPKHLWNTLQKQTNQVCFENKVYTKEMVLGSSRQGIRVSFVTDTRPIATISQFIEKSDLFICEGTYGDEADLDRAKAHKHMTFSEAANLAKQGQVKQLLLTHFGVALTEPEQYLDQVTTIFKNTKLGEDQLRVELNFALNHE